MFLIKFFAHFQLDYDVDDEREGGGAQLLRQLLRWHVFMGTREIIIWNLHYPSYAISSVSSANFDLKSLCMWLLLSTWKLFPSVGFFCPCNMKIRARVCVFIYFEFIHELVRSTRRLNFQTVCVGHHNINMGQTSFLFLPFDAFFYCGHQN